VIDMTVEKEIGGTVYKIRDDLTLGELSQIQDEAVEIDSRTMLTLTKVEKIRSQLIALCVVEPKITPEQASKLKVGVGLQLYAAIQVANGVPL